MLIILWGYLQSSLKCLNDSRKLANVSDSYRVLVGKTEEKRPLGRPRCRWEHNIKMDLQELGIWDVDWIGLAQDRDRRRALVNAVMNLRVP
jgi:hypothetical protein